MIGKVTSAAQRAQFLAAIGDCPVLQAQLTMRLALFGDLPGSGWQFYTAQPPSFALALRGASATVVGTFDPEELGSFLAFLGVDRLTTPAQTPPEGFAYHQTLFVYTLQAGKQLCLPTFTGDFEGQEGIFTLDKSPSVMQITPLLFPQEEQDAEMGDMGNTDAASDTGDINDTDNTILQDQYYADNTHARNAGMAEFWLLRHGDTPIFTLAASAVVGKVAYLSAGETIAAYRGQGIGGHYIVQMANEYAAKGYEVCFICEAVRCRFYERLGFAKAGVLYQYSPAVPEGE
ncbi:MAG: hypothetical protein R3Y06_07235 [Faecalibacterium sp.]